MKKNILALAILWTCAIIPTIAQSNVKIGYTNAEFVLMTLPETKQVEADLKEYEGQIGKEIKSKETELQTKYKNYVSSQKEMIPLVRQKKEEELQRLQQELQKFQQQAMVDFDQKKQKLLAPIYQKVQKGIESVAKENGYTYIISANAANSPVLIYASEEAQKNHDITEKVVTKLGGTMPKEKPKK